SIEIKATKAAVWSWIGNFKNADKWSPWNSLDTAMKKSFPENDGQVGAVYSWIGNENVGKGSQTINYTAENDSVGMTLEFKEPWQSKAQIGYKLTGEDGKVIMTQNMTGINGFMEALMGTIFGAEKMMDEKFTEGLNSLKKLAESGPANGGPSADAAYKVEEVAMPSTILATTEVKGKSFKTLTPEWYGEQYGAVGAYIGKNKLVSKNHAYCVYRNVDETMSKGDINTGMDVDKTAASADAVNCITVGGKALKVSYFGPYQDMQKAYMSIMSYAAANKLNVDYSVEHYVTDPKSTNGDWSKVQTDIYMVLK
ncbi:MAG: hypothetical protein IT244_09820, partial [Bacteroidia bacterium]|nr:hypothetical protein [Bacteroidia bacterium]